MYNVSCHFPRLEICVYFTLANFCGLRLILCVQETAKMLLVTDQDSLIDTR